MTGTVDEAQIHINRVSIDVDRRRLEQVEESIITLNREMGQVQGQLKVIMWLMGGTFLVALGQLAIDLLVR